VRSRIFNHFLTLAVCVAFIAVAAAPVVARAAEGAAPPKVESGEKPKADKDGGGKKDKADSDVTGGKFAGDPVYVHLQPMILPMISDAGAEQIVTILIDVQVKDITAADAMHTMMPRVKDAIFQALYGGLGDGSLRFGQTVNLPKVKIKIAKALDKTVGAEKVDDVLIQAVAQRVL
jgi:flagellar basal body-associated protein FliL